jgi:hypothetical protein
MLPVRDSGQTSVTVSRPPPTGASVGVGITGSGSGGYEAGVVLWLVLVAADSAAIFAGATEAVTDAEAAGVDAADAVAAGTELGLAYRSLEGVVTLAAVAPPESCAKAGRP